MKKKDLSDFYFCIIELYNWRELPQPFVHFVITDKAYWDEHRRFYEADISDDDYDPDECDPVEALLDGAEAEMEDHYLLRNTTREQLIERLTALGATENQDLYYKAD